MISIRARPPASRHPGHRDVHIAGVREALSILDKSAHEMTDWMRQLANVPVARPQWLKVLDSPDGRHVRTVQWCDLPVERAGRALVLGKDAMARSGGSVNTGGATRLVYVIGLLKWFALGAIALGVLGATALGFAGGDQLGPAISLLVWLYGIVAAVAVYVTMGRLQQTLLMLVGIAKNTAKDDILSRF